jgi:GNAT superfamily N-acetyltransferase
MPVNFELSRPNRIRLATAFRNVDRVDISIDTVLQNQMGEAFVDDADNPSAFWIRIGPFCYFAGEPGTPGCIDILKSIPVHSFIMASSTGWIDKAKELYSDRLYRFPRYSFSAEHLDPNHLDNLLTKSKHAEDIVRIDSDRADKYHNDPDCFFEAPDFESPADFVERGMGYCLVNNDAIEVSIFVMPDYRRQGIATALGASLARECLSAGMEPHWDAANPESCRLAEKLGYTQAGGYDAYVLLDEGEVV